MDVKLPPGKYVVAVSGGVDSMVLLDLLSKNPKTDIIVAHFDHGIRPDSSSDAKLVEKAAAKYGYPFELGHGRLGPKTSEEKARLARYAFLKDIQKKYQADAIITAHHQDDVIETALINILRGTGPKGLISLADTSETRRPLLGYRKASIKAYAQKNKIAWRQDTSNQGIDYLRNYLRNKILVHLSEKERQKLLNNIEKVAKNWKLQEKIIATLSQHIIKDNRIDRSSFSVIDPEVNNEIIADWLRKAGYGQFDRRKVKTANAFIRTGRPGSRYDVSKDLIIYVDKQSAWLERRV